MPKLVHFPLQFFIFKSEAKFIPLLFKSLLTFLMWCHGSEVYLRVVLSSRPPKVPWIDRIILFRITLSSVQNLHHNLESRAWLHASNLPIPSLPFSRGEMTLSHANMQFMRFCYHPETHPKKISTDSLKFTNNLF